MKLPEEKNYLSISQRLSTLVKEANIDVTTLSKYTGIPVATINRIKNDPYSNPTISTLIPLARFFSISIDDLVSSNTSNNKKLSNNKHLIPIIDMQNINQINFTQFLTEKNSLEVTSKIPNNCFAIRIKNKNSLNITKNFCYYVVEPQTIANDRDIIVATINKKENGIFRLMIDGEDYYIKSTSNPKKYQIISPKNLKIIGIVRQIIFE